MQETAISVQFVPRMRFLVFYFAGYCSCNLSAGSTGKVFDFAGARPNVLKVRCSAWAYPCCNRDDGDGDGDGEDEDEEQDDECANDGFDGEEEDNDDEEDDDNDNGNDNDNENDNNNNNNDDDDDDDDNDDDNDNDNDNGDDARRKVAMMTTVPTRQPGRYSSSWVVTCSGSYLVCAATGARTESLVLPALSVVDNTRCSAGSTCFVVHISVFALVLWYHAAVSLLSDDDGGDSDDGVDGDDDWRHRRQRRRMRLQTAKRPNPGTATSSLPIHHESMIYMHLSRRIYHRYVFLFRTKMRFHGRLSSLPSCTHTPIYSGSARNNGRFSAAPYKVARAIGRGVVAEGQGSIQGWRGSVDSEAERKGVQAVQIGEVMS
eukprot:3893958-Rhodomonas_salina.3